MSAHIIANPVPTPEEMGEILGLSPDRVKAVRQIMSTPLQQNKSAARAKTLQKAPAKKSVHARPRGVAAKG